MRSALPALFVLIALVLGCGGAGVQPVDAGSGGPGAGGDGGLVDAPAALTDGARGDGDPSSDGAGAGPDGPGGGTGDGGGPGDGGPAGPDGGGPDGAGPSTDALPGDDGGPRPQCTPLGTCDPFIATSCPANEVCYADGRPLKTSCWKMLNPTLRDGDDCSGNTASCGPGLVCHSYLDGVFRCRRYCPLGSRGFCGPTQRCGVAINNDQTEKCLGYCTPYDPPCDIYAQNCANPTDACRPARDVETDQRYNGCGPAGPRNEGEVCGSDRCAKGLICLNVNGASTCHRVCQASGTPACTGGKTCKGVTTTGISFCQ